MAKQPDEKKTNEDEGGIKAIAKWCLIAVPIGQLDIEVNVTRTKRQSPREMLRELMPSACQPKIDWLLEHAHFTQRDLYWACRYKALVADGPLLRRSKLTWMDYLLAAGYLIPASVMLLFFMAVMWFDTGRGAALLGERFALLGLISMSMFTIYFAVAVFVRPQLTAKSAVRALRQRSNHHADEVR